MQDLKQIFAGNLIRLRTAARMTQAELGERLNYSDKSVSKWERAESLPDAYVLKALSEMFGVTIDSLLSDPAEQPAVPVPAPEEPPAETELPYSPRFIIRTSVAGVWTLAVLLFILIWLWKGVVSGLVFAYALPVCLIVMLVMDSVWYKGRHNFFIISALVWSLLAAIYFTVPQKNWWQIFLLGIPAEMLIYFCFRIRR